MRKRFAVLFALLVIASLLVAACGGGAAPAPAQPAAPAGAQPAATTAPAAEQPAPAAPAASGDRVQIRWFVGLGTGSGADQIPAEEAVIARFNEMQDKIELVAEFVPNSSARDTLATQIASGAGPDIVGPVGWGGSNAFAGQYLDLGPFIELDGFDLTQFNPALVSMYQNEDGAQAGLPFAVFPAAVFYQTEMFDEAGLNYPPQNYGDPYVMPDGSEVPWNWDTLTEIARILTVDTSGNDASMVDFDTSAIVQYGFVFQWQTHPNYIGSYLGGASSLVAEDGRTAQVPAGWVEGWKWWHEGMWGDAPFIPTGPVVQSPEFGSGNAFSSGKVAMAVAPSWYTCCIADAGESWDLAVMPANADGTVNSRIDADTFRILKGTQHPEEAFEVLRFLIGEGSLDLLAVYGGMPARADDFDEWLTTKQEQFPFVTNWEAISGGLSYPDVPSAEAFVPNWNQVWDRVNALDSLMVNEQNLDLDAEAAKIESDIQAILNQAAQ
jgi:multiple sugar transport system substrate-binding protein